MTRAVDRADLASALIVANPAAGAHTTALVDEVVEACRARFKECDLTLTAGPGDATAAAAESRCDVVVCVGGDGTVREVAEGLASRRAQRPALLVLPAGSGNSFCRGLWGERDWRQVLSSALDHEYPYVRQLDLLRIAEHDRAAMLGVSAGFLAEVLVAARSVTGLAGADRYRAGAAAVLADMPTFPARLVVDDAAVYEGRACLVNIGGGCWRAAGMLRLMPRSVLDDGLLDVCVIDALPPDELATLLPLITTGEHLDHPRVTYAQGNRTVLTRTDDRPLLTEADGDVLPGEYATLSVDLRPGLIGVVAPPPDRN